MRWVKINLKNIIINVDTVHQGVICVKLKTKIFSKQINN